MVTTAMAADTLLQDIKQQLQHLWQMDVEITDCQPLSNRISVVRRIFLEGSGLPYSTLIVKHIQTDQYPAQKLEDIAQELREEMACYEFLQEAAGFALCARMLLADSRGFIVLEDVSEGDDSPLEDLDTLSSRLANTFAQLHITTYGKENHYLNIRQKALLPERQEDQRSYSLAAHRRRYRSGAACLKDYCQILGIGVPPTYHAYIDLAEAEMENPGPFLCFVHDDMANARQVIKRRNQFYLLDFENAKYSHALLDLCKPLAGKFEMLLDSGEFFYANPNFPLTLVQQYRERIQQHYGREFDDAFWDAAFTQALIYHGIALVGKLVEISAERRLRKNFAFDLFTILYRHSSLLSAFTTYSPVKKLMSDLLQALYQPEFNDEISVSNHDKDREVRQ